MTSISDTNVVNAPGGLVELGQNSTDRTNVAVTGTSTSNATELVATTIVCDGSPIIIEFQCGMSVTNGEYLSFGVWVDGVYTATFEGSLAVAGRSPISAWSRLIPTAGAKTISIRWWKWSGGTSTSYIEGMCRVRVSKIIQASQLIVQTPNAPLVTSLPSNAIDGQEVRYLADNTNGIIWNFRYRAGSSSAYKWEFIGGSSLKNSYSSQISANNSGFTSCNCSITLPLAGDYDFDFGAMVESTYNSGQTNVYLNTTGASSSYVISSRNQDTSTRVDSSGASYARIAGISANTSYNLWLNITNATYGWGNYFWLKTVPVRVSA